MGLGRGLGCGFGRGVRWGIHLHGGGLRGSFGLGLRGLLSPTLGFRLGWLGGRLSYDDRWGPVGTYGNLLCGPMGAFGDSNGDLWGPRGTYGDLWGPIRAYGDLWGP